ncbi:MAG: hypothetical protein M3N21_07680 [Actinomycetota bacterium]|nr:hypothetical protein [Actinomycetota bacterium]
MTRNRSLLAVVAAGVTALSVGLAPQVTSGGVALAGSAAPIGPSGLPAVQRTYLAGHTPAVESAPQPAVPTVADRNSIADQLAYAKQAAALPQGPAMPWDNVGPFGQDDPPNSNTGTLRFARSAGMGVAVAVDPRDKSGNTIFIGNMGGLWHSSDGGSHWTHLGDGFVRSAVGAVALDPRRPDDVYVGTGISLLTISGDTAGAGVYVSHDGGKHFSRPAKNVTGYGTNAITVTAKGVLVGTSHGLYASTDRGASFNEVMLPSNADHSGQAKGAYANWISAIVANPGHENEVTVAIGMGYGKRLGPDGKPLSPGNGLYRSVSGPKGPFTFLASATAGLTNPANSNDPIGRIALSYGARTGENYVLWALVSDAGLTNAQQPAGLDLVGSTTGKSLNPSNTVLNGAYRSDDNGATWTLKANSQTLTSSVNDSLIVTTGLGYGVGVQGFYNLWIAADPSNTSQVYLGLEEVFQSAANAGNTPGLASFDVIQRYWDVCGSTTEFDNITKGVACPPGTPYSGVATHPDQHVGVAVPTSHGVRLYTGNDGGFFRQDSHAISGGRTGFDNNGWQDMNTLATLQPWHVARKPDGEYLAAQQDNGAGFFGKGNTESLVTGGDGVQLAATSNPDVWYSSAQGDVLYVTKDHGVSVTNINPNVAGGGFLAPFAVDPTDENHLVAAGQDVQESTKGPNTTVLADPVLGNVVQTDWVKSFGGGNSPAKTAAGKAILWDSQAIGVRGAAVYVGMCGRCRNSLGNPKDINTTVATNVKPGCTAKKAAGDCWHFAKGIGLPHVAIWNIAVDPADVRTIYVALNENSLIGLDPKVVGAARLLVSHDAGDHFTDITGRLPRSNVRDVVVRDGKLIVATDNGVFIGAKNGSSWARLGKGLPQVRIFDLSLDPNGRHLTISAYGRGVWDLDFGHNAVTSSSGKGPGGRTSAAVPVGADPGGRLPLLPVGLTGLLVLAFLARRRLIPARGVAQPAAGLGS